MACVVHARGVSIDEGFRLAFGNSLLKSYMKLGDTIVATGVLGRQQSSNGSSQSQYPHTAGITSPLFDTD